MGFFFVVVLTFTTSCLIYTGGEAQEPSFCDICECILVHARYDINCNTNVLNTFDSSYWNDWSKEKTHRSLKVESNSICRLDRQFPESSITSLSLERCSIKSISDSIFSNLQFLETLELSHNSIEKLHPKAFVGQYTKNTYLPLPLKNLSMDHNRINTLPEEIFQYTPNIAVLSLAHNPLGLDRQTVKAINSLVVLKKLDISYAELYSLPETFLQSHKNLQSLNLDGNLFMQVPTVLGNIINLEVLYFNNNPLAYLSSGGFPKIQSLNKLFMCDMAQLGEIGPLSFSTLTSLEILHICNNTKLNNIHKDAFLLHDATRFWLPFKKLYLNNNSLTTLDKGLLNWNYLDVLDLTNNPWNCECKYRWIIDDDMWDFIYFTDDEKNNFLRCGSPSSLQNLTFKKIYEENRMDAECGPVNEKSKSNKNTKIPFRNDKIYEEYRKYAECDEKSRRNKNIKIPVRNDNVYIQVYLTLIITFIMICYLVL